MEIKNMPKACVILGAGASYDVIGNRGGSDRPPLADELFSPDRWIEELNRYPGAKYLSPKLENLREKGLEDALQEYASHSVPEISDKFKEIPAYIQDVVSHSTRRFLNRPDAYTELVGRLLAGPPSHAVLFIILNYDALLETALSQYSKSRFTFKTLADYVADEQAIEGLSGTVAPHPLGQVTFDATFLYSIPPH